MIVNKKKLLTKICYRNYRHLFSHNNFKTNKKFRSQLKTMDLQEKLMQVNSKIKLINNNNHYSNFNNNNKNNFSNNNNNKLLIQIIIEIIINNWKQEVDHQLLSRDLVNWVLCRILNFQICCGGAFRILMNNK